MQLSTLISRSRNRFVSASRNVTPGWTGICTHEHKLHLPYSVYFRGVGVKQH